MEASLDKTLRVYLKQLTLLCRPRNMCPTWRCFWFLYHGWQREQLVREGITKEVTLEVITEPGTHQTDACAQHSRGSSSEQHRKGKATEFQKWKESSTELRDSLQGTVTKETKQGPIMMCNMTDSLLAKNLFLGDEISTINIRTILYGQKNKYSQFFFF